MKNKPVHKQAPGPQSFPRLTDEQQRVLADTLLEDAEDDPEERSQLLCEAAGTYAQLGHIELAEQLYRRALDEGGEVIGGVHGYFAELLFEQGRDQEALELVEQARKARPRDPAVFENIGDVLAQNGRFEDAAKWYTRGLAQAFGELAEVEAADLREDLEMGALARGRRDCRRELGLAADHLDELYGEVEAERKVTAAPAAP